MLEATTAQMLINGLLSWLTTYVNYKIATKKAENEGETPKAQPVGPKLELSENALAVVENVLIEHGSDEDRDDFDHFQKNPERYHSQMKQVLLDLTSRHPQFLTQVQELLQGAGIQAPSIISNQYISGGSIKQNIGINFGSIQQDSNTDASDPENV